MKKKTFICGWAMLIICSCAQQKPVEKTVLGIGTDYMYFPESLTGKIKELRETNYWAVEKEGKIIKGDPATWKDLDSVGSIRNLVAYFDDKGTLTRYELIDEKNVIRNSIVGTLENGKVVRWDFKSKDSTTQYVIPEYDNKGYFVGGKTYRPIADTIISRFVLTYDDNGNYTRVENFDFKNMKRSYQVFSLNELQKVIEVKFYSGDDTLRQTFMNTYNDKGLLATQTVTTERPKSVIKWDVQDLLFDDNGNLLQCYSNVDDGKFKLVAERTYIYY